MVVGDNRKDRQRVTALGGRRRGPEVTPRDVAILLWLGRHGIVTAEQVARRFFTRDVGTVGLWATYRRLRKLEALGLLRRDRTFWKEPVVLRLTLDGARVADVDVGPAHLILAEVRHGLAVVDLTERLLAENPGAVLRTERELRAERWRQRRDGTRLSGQGRTPDGVFQLDSGQTVAVELDLTPKRSRQIARIVAAYGVEPFTRIWWYVAAGPVAERVREVVRSLHANDYIEVREWSNA